MSSAEIGGIAEVFAALVRASDALITLCKACGYCLVVIAASQAIQAGVALFRSGQDL